MNSVNLVGRLTKDPELKYSQNGKPIAKFTLAVDRYNSDADFIRVVAFDKKAEAVANYIRKGQQLGVTGSIKTGSYEKDDGSKVFTTDVYADKFDFPPKAQNTEPSVSVEGFQQDLGGDDEFDSDLPF